MRQSGLIPKYSAAESAEVLFLRFSTFTKDELVPPLSFRKDGQSQKSQRPAFTTPTGPNQQSVVFVSSYSP